MHTILLLLFFLLSDDNTRGAGKTDSNGRAKQTRPAVTTLSATPATNLPRTNSDTTSIEPILSHKQTTPTNAQLYINGSPVVNGNLPAQGNTSGKTSTIQPANLIAQ